MASTRNTTTTRPARRPRLKDVAAAASVSVATASMALSDHPHVNHETKRRVRRIGQQLGYRKADTIGRAARFGFFVVGTDVHHEINAQLIYHLSEIGVERGERIEFGAVREESDIDRIIEHARRFGGSLDGVLINGVWSQELSMRLDAAGVRHVILGHVRGGFCDEQPLPTSTVAFHDTGMGYLATRRLIESGRRRVAFVCEIAPPGMQHDRWRRGYQLAHLDAGVPIDPELIVVTGEREAGEAAAVERLLALDSPPTAYVVPDARIAGSVLTELARAGHELPRDAIVFAASEPIVRALGLTDYPHLIGRTDLMAQYGLAHLRRLRRATRVDPVEMLVGFKALNLPTGDIAKLAE